MNITKDEAIRILSRYDNEHYTPKTRLAHRMGAEALNRVEELETELRDERHRRAPVQLLTPEAQELEFYKNATVRLREQWSAAETLICTMCGHCQYEEHGDVLIMQHSCGEVCGYPCCGKFMPRTRWTPALERKPDEEFLVYWERHHEDPEFIVLIEGATIPTVLYYDKDGSFYGYGDDGVEFYRVTHWQPLPEAPCNNKRRNKQ